jgi:hypothetical protein
MNNLNYSQQALAESLAKSFPDQTEFYPKTVYAEAEKLGVDRKDADRLVKSQPKVRRGVYNLEAVLQFPTKETPKPMSSAISSITNDEVFVPSKDKFYVPWGNFNDVKMIINSGQFYPTYITGLSGNGKTTMVEQACAITGREYVRVQITPETDEDDLIGGFRLVNGETVFSKGPVLKAMERGAILLIDEIDRASNKIMCLQGVLEGKPVLVKKTGEMVSPADGFNVIATANTKGKGSEDGRFVAATIIDEAFLERFNITIEQPYPTAATEKKIVLKHMEKFGKTDMDFATKLITWSEVIRKTFEDDGVDEIISTRRLCHITQTFAIFGDKMKSIEMCINRFDTDTKEAFLDLYTKVDGDVLTNTNEGEVND